MNQFSLHDIKNLKKIGEWAIILRSCIQKISQTKKDSCSGILLYKNSNNSLDYDNKINAFIVFDCFNEFQLVSFSNILRPKLKKIIRKFQEKYPILLRLKFQKCREFKTEIAKIFFSNGRCKNKPKVIERRYIVRYYDGYSKKGIAISSKISRDEAIKIWEENTDCGLINTSPEDINYYKIFPANFKILQYSN